MSSDLRYFQAIWFPSRLRLSKLRPPSDLVDQVHVSGALSGACTGKGSQMANPRPTPKPGPGSKVTGVIPSEIQPVSVHFSPARCRGPG